MSAIQVVHKNGQFIFTLCSEEKFVIYVSPPYDRGRRRGGGGGSGGGRDWLQGSAWASCSKISYGKSGIGRCHISHHCRTIDFSVALVIKSD